MATSEAGGPKGCMEQGAQALWALTLIAGLLGVLRKASRPRHCLGILAATPDRNAGTPGEQHG